MNTTNSEENEMESTIPMLNRKYAALSQSKFEHMAETCQGQHGGGSRKLDPPVLLSQSAWDEYKIDGRLYANLNTWPRLA